MIKVINTVGEIKRLRTDLKAPVALVPTMGYLHDGHLSLIRTAVKECVSVVVSIFVNPTQFNPGEDFKSYPRDLEHDLSLLEKESVDIVFNPSLEEMYPESFSSWVEVSGITERLEGKSRPTHFRGVTTVVAKLFNIIMPDKAYFGQKDAQQAIVIKKMVKDLNMDIEIITLPTVREADGLAMSSRNNYLKPRERQAATILYKALKEADKLYKSGVKSADSLRRKIREVIDAEPLAEIDYISIADNETLVELDEVVPPALVSLAVKIGKTRLIDNIVIYQG